MLEAHAIIWARLVGSQAQEVFEVDFTFRERVFAIGRGVAKTGRKGSNPGAQDAGVSGRSCVRGRSSRRQDLMA